MEPELARSAVALAKCAEVLDKCSKAGRELAKAGKALVDDADALSRKASKVDPILFQSTDELVASAKSLGGVARIFARPDVGPSSSRRSQFLLGSIPPPPSNGGRPPKRKAIERISRVEYERLKETRLERTLEYQGQKLRKEQELIRNKLSTPKEKLVPEADTPPFEVPFLTAAQQAAARLSEIEEQLVEIEGRLVEIERQTTDGTSLSPR